MPREDLAHPSLAGGRIRVARHFFCAIAGLRKTIWAAPQICAGRNYGTQICPAALSKEGQYHKTHGPYDSPATLAGRVDDRFALNCPQVQRYRPPPNPTKLTDSPTQVT